MASGTFFSNSLYCQKLNVRVVFSPIPGMKRAPKFEIIGIDESNQIRDPREYPRDPREHPRDPREYPREYPRDPREHPRDPREHPREYPRDPREDPRDPREDHYFKFWPYSDYPRRLYCNTCLLYTSPSPRDRG